MSQSPSSAAGLVSVSEPSLTLRRIRHVAAVQVRNLTPFPVRDTFASALSQPSEQPQFTSHGHLSDDLDVTIQQRRSRRISTNSIATYQSLRSDDGDDGERPGSIGDRGRRASGSRVGFSPGGSSHTRAYTTSGSTSTAKSLRPRTTSIASSVISGALSGSLRPANGSEPVATHATLFPENSQVELQKVLSSRLVETFLTITVPPSVTPEVSAVSLASSPPRSNSYTSTSTREKKLASQQVKTVGHNLTSTTGLSGPPVRGAAKTRRDSSSSTRFVPSKTNSTHVKSASTSVARHSGRADISSSQVQVAPSTSHPPIFFSAIHRPSTNPSFPVDGRLEYDFTEATDLSGCLMKIEIWGRMGPGDRQKKDLMQKKGKERDVVSDDNLKIEWRVLDSWEVDLEQLIPLSDDLISHPSHLPSNTLVIKLSPPGELFYLPSHLASRSRSPAASTGYASDPETEVRKVKQSGVPLPEAVNELTDSRHSMSKSRRRHRAGIEGQQNTTADLVKTAGWQDLFNVVTLQSCILDTKNSLDDIVEGIDKILDADAISQLRREISEREARVEESIVNRRRVIEESERLKHEMEVRIENLRQRKEMLALAYEQHREELDLDSDKEEEILHDRTRHLTLRSRFGPTRTTLLTTLSTIFPIELLSPPDLLYTILEVPLPIPLTTTDPAPPLTLSSHKDVNEDVVATSLGYVAQVVQLLAAYLGKGLVYPVTCIGSRSLIRDGISAMVGPRMFPLFSKGVDTYRFEYAVFLLNKDIELLMADRDLRALDMRHTLPNLKNLLLTLTDGEGIPLPLPRPPLSPGSLLSNMEELTPSRADSPLEANTSTPRPSSTVDLPSDGNTPPASGSSTPTIVEPSKRSRPFLAFSPLTDFIRGRYPSSSRTSTKETLEPDNAQEQEVSPPLTPYALTEQANNDDGEEGEEDRKTIHAVARDDSMDGNRVTNSLGVTDGNRLSEEKPALKGTTT